MTEATPARCPHELRPGTTVCLRCRNEARLAARTRLRRNILVVGLPAFGLVVIAIFAALRLPAFLRSRASAPNESPSPPPVTVAAPPLATTPTVAPVAPTPAPPVAVGPPLTPKIAQGRTALADGMYAERSDSVVIVHFDAPATRTRRPEKFERIVRTTLPVIYGPVADSILAHIPQGSLIGSADLVTALPTNGLQLPLADGWTLGVWPETRPGRDGPLVVLYRITVTKGAARN
jgi:hypothetical protein